MPIYNPKYASNNAAGFSLLEILVVLAIMGLMLSVVSVRLVRTIESAYFSRTADAAVADILSLRADAILKGENRILVTDMSRLKPLSERQKKTFRRLNLPEGWSADGEPITISHTGTCFGGNIVISDNTGRRASYRLAAPKCAAERYEPVVVQQDAALSQQALESP